MVDLTWNQQEVVEQLQKHFGLSESYIQQQLDTKIRSTRDRERLVAILQAVGPACEQFAGKIDAEGNLLVNEKLKNKVGKLLLSRLDYDSFSDEESPRATYYRLRTEGDGFFGQTTEMGINPYKIIYATVLTNANLRDDYQNGVKDDRCEARQFLAIYHTLRSTLRLSREETNELFEKCSSLASKCYSTNISAIYQELLGLTIVSSEEARGSYLFRTVHTENDFLPREKRVSVEIENILKVNPSLFMAKPERLKKAFAYVCTRVPKEQIEEVYQRALVENPQTTMTRFDAKVQILRSWIKDNSTLLTMNVSDMKKKESLLLGIFNQMPPEKQEVYRGAFRSMINNPVSLSILSGMKLSDMAKIDATDHIIKNYAAENIALLESYTTPEKVAKYIKENHYFLAMSTSKLSYLLQLISDHDKENPDNAKLEVFLKFGKTLFASNVEFNPDEIFAKLNNLELLNDLDVDKMSDAQRLSKFVELFFDGNMQVENEIVALIRQKHAREKAGESEVRRAIRLLGKNTDWRSVVKDKQSILRLTTEIGNLHLSRFKLADTAEYDRSSVGYFSTREEKRNADRIEGLLTTLRDAYEKKRFNVGKKFTNVEKLFNYTMMYLEQEFDDHLAISDLFREEITKPLEDALISEYGCDSSIETLFGGVNRTITVDKPSLVYPLKGLVKAVERNDASDVQANTIRIERHK